MKNQQLESLIVELKKASISHEANIWKRIATELEGPTSRMRVVNLSKIDCYSKDNEVVIVPGKVLSMGNLSKKITIAAYKYSKGAMSKIRESGSKAVSIYDILKNNPKGAKVRIIG
ncbi:50S ribosomal protein L18e [Candidatus Woesearchaeota archaeon]|nr:50S ribosomal protein L18e [Candidatus Woesearchaeota archaeon]